MACPSQTSGFHVPNYIRVSFIFVIVAPRYLSFLIGVLINKFFPANWGNFGNKLPMLPHGKKEEYKHSYFEVNELRKSVEFISSKLDSLREELAHTRHELNSTQEEMKRLVQENDHLKQEVSDLQQYTRRDNIMLFGVPEIDEQSTHEVFDQISEVIGCSELVQHDVSVAHRIPSRPGKTRPIVIRFTKTRSRDEWLQLFRNEAKNDGSGPGIATKKVNRDLPAGRITAGDQLTAVTRDLLNKTRVARKDEASPMSKITNVDDVGHTFLLGTKYSQPLKATFKTTAGKPDLLQMGSYGLGMTRILAAGVEALCLPDEIRWPIALSPFIICIIPPKGIGAPLQQLQESLQPDPFQCRLESGELEEMHNSVDGGFGSKEYAQMLWSEQGSEISYKGRSGFLPLLYSVKISKKMNEGSKESEVAHLAEELYHKLNSIDVFRNNVIIDDRCHMTIGKRLFESRRVGYPFIVVIGRKALQLVPEFEVHDILMAKETTQNEFAVIEYLKQCISEYIKQVVKAASLEKPLLRRVACDRSAHVAQLPVPHSLQFLSCSVGGGVMIKNIKSEIEEAPFVAIVVDETSDCSNQSQLSTILRYVDSTANVQERFIGFTNVSSGKTAAALFQHVEGVIAEYNVGNKLIAQTYDDNTMEPPLKRRKGDDELKYRQLYYSILDRMHMEITDRFSDYGKLQFTHLLDSQKFSAYREKFPNEALNKLFQSYNSHFDQKASRKASVEIKIEALKTGGGRGGFRGSAVVPWHYQNTEGKGEFIFSAQNLRETSYAYTNSTVNMIFAAKHIVTIEGLKNPYDGDSEPLDIVVNNGDAIVLTEGSGEISSNFEICPTQFNWGQYTPNMLKSPKHPALQSTMTEATSEVACDDSANVSVLQLLQKMSPQAGLQAED
ncbi:hypothetical protein ANN_09451 [Periplaneta americana]|uniref:Proline--tRNA ligase n=1 Tax=Periplaneta americana TaxID=6978 RepID=A0ABQ8TLC6_PERAM|nr:hypothetical protein ANN_09451 [Periplaneta americana]